MRISKFFKNYRSKQSLLEENQRLIDENDKLRKKLNPWINPPIFNTIQFNIQEFAVSKTFNKYEYMKLTDEYMKEIMAYDFLDVVKENIETEKQRSINRDEVTIIARLNLAVKR